MDVRSHASQRLAGGELIACVREGRKAKKHTEPISTDVGKLGRSCNMQTDVAQVSEKYAKLHTPGGDVRRTESSRYLLNLGQSSLR